jgi:hypothetical protein
MAPRATDEPSIGLMSTLASLCEIVSTELPKEESGRNIVSLRKAVECPNRRTRIAVIRSHVVRHRDRREG